MFLRVLSHLFGTLPLHLGGAGCRGPKHAGSDADGQVECVHLVVVGVALDAVQHGHHVAQQEQVVAGQKAEQPESDGGKKEKEGGENRFKGRILNLKTQILLLFDLCLS